MSGLADKFNDIKEAKYASHQREPLGRPASRGYAWPQQVQNEKDFRFGVISGASESAKDLLFPSHGAEPEKPEVAQMYAKTHGNIKEGTQKKRDYEWPVDPQTNTFGYGEHIQPNGAARSIHSERFEQSWPKTVIVQKTVEDMKAAN